MVLADFFRMGGEIFQQVGMYRFETEDRGIPFFSARPVVNNAKLPGLILEQAVDIADDD